MQSQFRLSKLVFSFFRNEFSNYCPYYCNIKTTFFQGLCLENVKSSTTDSLKLVSQEIYNILGIEVAVLMGANLAPEVANDNFCEATIGNKYYLGLILFKS